ncbi:MAG: hypothetical protein ACYTBJ_20350 [Planctomycetota bacterium]
MRTFRRGQASFDTIEPGEYGLQMLVFRRCGGRRLRVEYDVRFRSAFRAYPNNPLYCGRLQSPTPALSAQNVLNVE